MISSFLNELIISYKPQLLQLNYSRSVNGDTSPTMTALITYPLNPTFNFLYIASTR